MEGQNESVIISGGPTGETYGLETYNATTNFYNGKLRGHIDGFNKKPNTTYGKVIITGTEENGTYVTRYLSTGGYHLMNEDGSYVAYKTLTEATNAATRDNQRITIIGGLEESTGDTITKNITLDLQGYTITKTGSYGITINANTTLTIIGEETGKIKGTGIFNTLTNNGRLEINGVTIETTTLNSSCAPIYNKDTLVVNSGNITGVYIGIKNGDTSDTTIAATTTINGGTITATNTSSGYGIYNYSYATSSSYPKTVYVNGGTIEGGRYGIYNYARGSSYKYAYTTIGNVDNQVNSETPIISGGTHGISNFNGLWYFYDGILKGTTAGFSGNPSGVAPGYQIYTDTDTITSMKTAYLAPKTNQPYYLNSSGVGYATLSDAYVNASSTDTITIMKDIVDSSNIIMNESKTITIATGGYTAIFTNPIQLSTGSLITENNGAIKNNTTNTIEISGDSQLIVRRGTIQSTNGNAVNDISNASIIIGNSSEEISDTNPKIIGSIYGINSTNIESSNIEFYNGLICGRDGALTNNLLIENTLGKVRDNYVSELSTDVEEYNCLKLRAKTINIVENPISIIRGVGEAATFTTEVTGNGNVSYQWYKNETASNFGGTIIDGAISNTYSILSVSASDAGFYYCITKLDTHIGEIATSTVAQLKVENNYSITNQATKYYGTLIMAVAAANDENDIIKLENSITDDSIETITEKSIAIDLQDNTLTRTKSLTIDTGSTLTILGNDSGKMYFDHRLVWKTPGGYWTFYNSGCLYNKGALNINGGVIDRYPTDSLKDDGTLQNAGSGEINISGGTIMGKVGIRHVSSESLSSPRVTITGGTINCNKYGIYNTPSTNNSRL